MSGLRGLAGRVRVSIGLLVFAVCLTTTSSCGKTRDGLKEPWFSGYMQLTMDSTTDAEAGTATLDRTVLAFVVADTDDGCSASWIDGITVEEASETLKLEQQIAGLRHDGGDVVISFGGATGDELATACTDVGRLVDAYRAVIDRYQIDIVDFDIEMNDLDDEDASIRRAEAVAKLQQDRPGADPLEVWLTLPVGMAGLGAQGERVVADMLEAGVDLAGVNFMTMNFGADKLPGQDVLDASMAAARAGQRQLKARYADAGQELSDDQAWNKVGLTPMIGQNDVREDIFGLKDAVQLNSFVHEQGIGRLSFWSVNRDRPCGPEYADVRQASYMCSGVQQELGEFSRVLGEGFGR
jgi:chitinase